MLLSLPQEAGEQPHLLPAPGPHPHPSSARERHGRHDEHAREARAGTERDTGC